MKMLKYQAKNPFKYEMTIRKENWKSLSDSLEKQCTIPLEQQPSIVKALVSASCYKRLVPLLDLPPLDESHASTTTTVDSTNPDGDGINGLVPETKKTLSSGIKHSVQSGESRSTISPHSSFESVYSPQLTEPTVIEPFKKSDTLEQSKVTEYEALSNFVEVDKKILCDASMIMKHKAILRFLALPEGEVATWRPAEAKGLEELSEMTLEQQGDFLINKIATDFCEWMRQLGGDEKSFINEEIIKELFEICMDNPASRGICIKTREKRVLYYNLAEFLQVPEKSFPEALLTHLLRDAAVEKLPSRLIAFNKALPTDLQFKTPSNKTSETWLEWNKYSVDQLRFSDVYNCIKDLRSTQEYCKWLLNHPEHKKPQYLIDHGLFELGLEKKDDELSHIPIIESTTTNISETSGNR